MSEWIFINKNEIQHVNGFKLKLNEGCWGEPKDIRPRIPEKLKLNPIEIAMKIREGLKFATEIPSQVMTSNSSNFDHTKSKTLLFSITHSELVSYEY